MEENLKIDPPIEGLEKEVEVWEVLATIFSKEPIDLRNPIDEPGEEEIPAGDVEVINPITGEIEKIRSNDPSYYDAGGFKARKYKHSSKPKDIPPWASIAEEQKRPALEEKDKKRAKRKSMVTLGIIEVGLNDLEKEGKEEQIPAMPVCQLNPQTHRVKCVRLSLQSGERAINTLVARPVGKEGN